MPERPRLRSGCCLFEDGEALILRSVNGAYRFAPAQRPIMQRLLTHLDGTRDYDALLGGECPTDAFFALHVLDDMAQSGVVQDGPSPVTPKPSAPAGGAPKTKALEGVRLVRLGAGQLASALESHLERQGALLRSAASESAGRNDVVLRCLDTPNLQALEEYDRQAIATGHPYLPVFPFGDALLVGPVVQPGIGPCLRCFELRWLGISQNVQAELAYFSMLRAAPPGSGPSSEQLAAYAELAGSFVAERLVQQDAFSWTVIDLETRCCSTSKCEPHPHCELCGRSARVESAPRSDVWSEAPIALLELGRRLEPLANGPCSIASVQQPPRGMVVPAEPLTIVVSRFAFPDPERIDGAQHNFAHGSARTREAARTLAIIEALERYGGLLPPPPGVEATYESIAADAVLPTLLPLFSAAQYAKAGFPFQPFSPDRLTRWCWGHNLTKQRRVLVPTSAAYYGYDDSLLGECSSGVAAHSSRGCALLNGLYELVERDAFMIHWLNRLSPPHLDHARIGTPHSHALLRGVERAGYGPHVLDLTTDLGIPVVLALGVREDRKKPALLLGAGASLDPRIALERALSELFSATCSKSELWTSRSAMAPEEVRSLADHSRAYEHPDWLPHAAFLWASAAISTPFIPAFVGDFRVQLATAVARLESHGHDVIGVDMTAPDVGRYGLCTVRAIALGLQPLALAPGPRLGGTRWSHAPLRMGHRTAPTLEEALYTMPHCFP